LGGNPWWSSTLGSLSPTLAKPRRRRRRLLLVVLTGTPARDDGAVTDRARRRLLDAIVAERFLHNTMMMNNV
jgi:hypothetical protein